jgi:hypothetical protein
MKGSASLGTHYRGMVGLLLGTYDHRGSVVKRLGAAMPTIV